MNEQSIFIEALERADPQERAAYLDQACQGDAALRQRLERLLAQHFHAGAFLEAGILPAPPGMEGAGGEGATATHDAPLTERAGAVIAGKYKLLEQIGEGGMGTVWMAQQTEPVKRLVAVKLIKPGMDSKAVLARFDAERQALALMDHPNIAKVFDGGSPRPYFVMELVKGVPITKYCDQHRLTPRQRLELFVPVCHAIQHAHQKGIIHRDLKPSNVLIALYDDKPVPKVIDFGVAKATGTQLTEATLHTGFGAVVGTVEYMSPEQATFNQLDVDTRSDIYSLGVLLYELLAGSPPFTRKELEKAGMLEMLRVIREQEPSKPSTKLSTADGLPTLATNRGTEPAKLTKLVRGELDWIVMKALEKDRSRRYETANGFAMDVQRYLADEAVQACPPSAGYRLRKFVRRHKRGLVMAGVILLALITLAGSVGWNLRDWKARQAAIEGEAQLALNEAELLLPERKYPEALSATKRAEALLAGTASNALRHQVRELRRDLEMVDRLEDIRLLRAAAGADEQTFDYGGADQAYARAFRDYGIDVEALEPQKATQRIRARPVRLELLSALDDWANARFSLQKESWKQVLAIARAADDDPVRNRFRDAWERLKDIDEKAVLELASTVSLADLPPSTVVLVAELLRRRGAISQATAGLRLAQRKHPGDFWLNFELAFALSQMPSPLWDEAGRFYTAALAIRPASAPVCNNLGLALEKTGHRDEAIAAYREAIRLKPELPQAHFNLGRALRDKGRVDEAIAEFRYALRVKPNYAKAHCGLANVLSENGLLDEAIAEYRQAAQLQPHDAPTHNNLGNLLFKQGQLEDAVAELQAALRLKPVYPLAHTNLGLALAAQGKLDQAIAAHQESIRLQPDYAEAYTNLGNTFWKKKAWDEAIAAHKEAIRLKPNLAAAHFSLGNAFFDKGALDEAIAAWIEGIRLKPDYANPHANLGKALMRKGNLNDAIASFKEAIRLQPDLPLAHYDLGSALMKKGDHAAAIAAYKEAGRLKPDYLWSHSSLAWLLTTCPEPALRDPQRALDEAQQAVALAPSADAAAQAAAWRALGMARYRLGEWNASIQALEKSSALLKNASTAFDWFPLALAHWQEGNKDEARRWYDKAVAWMEKYQPQNEQLRLLRAEAAELLGKKQQPGLRNPESEKKPMPN